MRLSSFSLIIWPAPLVPTLPFFLAKASMIPKWFWNHKIVSEFRQFGTKEIIMIYYQEYAVNIWSGCIQLHDTPETSISAKYLRFGSSISAKYLKFGCSIPSRQRRTPQTGWAFPVPDLRARSSSNLCLDFSMESFSSVQHWSIWFQTIFFKVR